MTAHDARPVDRWDCFIGEDLGGNACIDDREDPHGRYVRFEDYDALRAEVERLRAENEMYCKYIDTEVDFEIASAAEEWKDRAEAAEAQLRHEQECHKQTVRLRAEAEARLVELSDRINERFESYHRQGPDYTLDGEPMIYAAFLEELRAALNDQGQGNG